jgi:hypothetical protein
MISTIGDSSASRTQVLLSQPPMQNSCQLTTRLAGSQSGGHFTLTCYSSLHRMTSNWQQNSLTHHPATSRHFPQLTAYVSQLQNSTDRAYNTFGTNHIENIFSIFMVQQYLYRCMRIRCRGNLLTERLPSDNPGIFDVFTGRNQATHIPSCDRCRATVLHATIYTLFLHIIHNLQNHVINVRRLSSK